MYLGEVARDISARNVSYVESSYTEEIRHCTDSKSVPCNEKNVLSSGITIVNVQRQHLLTSP